MRSAMRSFGVTLVVTVSAQAGAAVVVDFNGTTNAYLTSGTESPFQRAQSGAIAGNYDNDANADDSIVGIGFSDTLALNPGTNYNTALPSATFFGGIERIRIDSASDGNAFDRVRVRDSSGNDAINVRFRLQNGDIDVEDRTYRTAGVFAWSVGATHIDLTQDATITPSIGITGIDKAMLVARQGGQWYIGPQIGFNAAFNYDGDGGNFWKAVDFSATLNEDTSSGFSQIDLADVSMIGLYFEDDFVEKNAGTNVYYSEITVTRFSVDAALVPEPASVLLLAAMGTMALRRRRVG